MKDSIPGATASKKSRALPIRPSWGSCAVRSKALLRWWCSLAGKSRDPRRAEDSGEDSCAACSEALRRRWRSVVGKPRRAARRSTKRDTRYLSACGGVCSKKTWRRMNKTAAHVARASVAAQSKEKLLAESCSPCEDGVPIAGLADGFSKAADAERSAALSEPEALPDVNSCLR